MVDQCGVVGGGVVVVDAVDAIMVALVVFPGWRSFSQDVDDEAGG